MQYQTNSITVHVCVCIGAFLFLSVLLNTGTYLFATGIPQYYRWRAQANSLPSVKSTIEKYCTYILVTGSVPVCLESEFSCLDGSCIPFDLRCDGVVHCNDGSDEQSNYGLSRGGGVRIWHLYFYCFHHRRDRNTNIHTFTKIWYKTGDEQLNNWRRCFYQKNLFDVWKMFILSIF